MSYNFPKLTDIELRVLGSLIEKSRSTPEYYPMTLNAITLACNQKTSRKPVTDYSESEVSAALSNLKGISLVSTAIGGSIRSVKYKHNLTTVLPIGNAELSILCLLFLRGPQTPGELNTNSSRLYEFSSLNEIYEVLQKLTQAEKPYVTELSRQAGQKETRFKHLLGINSLAMLTTETDKSSDLRISSDLESRIIVLEREVQQLNETVQKWIQDKI